MMTSSMNNSNILKKKKLIMAENRNKTRSTVFKPNYTD